MDRRLAERPVTEEIARQFELASMRREARSLRSPDQWRDVAQLARRCENARKREQGLFENRYHTRVEQARLRLIDKAGAKEKAFQPAWSQADRFSPQATVRQAEREVRAAHHQRLDRIDAYERQKLEELVRGAQKALSRPGSAREAFGGASRRPSEMERRGGWVRRRD